MMKAEVATGVTIAAPPGRVWETLLDFPAHGDWNPFIRDIRGEAAPGARLSVRVNTWGLEALVFHPVVTVLAPPRELRWAGNLVSDALVFAEHAFVLENAPGGRTRLLQVETCRGALVPLLWPWLRFYARPSFERMNRALKRRCEGGRP